MYSIRSNREWVGLRGEQFHSVLLVQHEVKTLQIVLLPWHLSVDFFKITQFRRLDSQLHVWTHLNKLLPVRQISHYKIFHGSVKEISHIRILFFFLLGFITITYFFTDFSEYLLFSVILSLSLSLCV